MQTLRWPCLLHLGPCLTSSIVENKDSPQGLGLELPRGHGTHVVQAREPAQWPRATPVWAGGAAPQEEATPSGVYTRQSPTNRSEARRVQKAPREHPEAAGGSHTHEPGAVAGSSPNHAGLEAAGPGIIQLIPWLHKFIPDIPSDAQEYCKMKGIASGTS